MALSIGLRPPSPIPLSNHHVGSAPLALPRVKSEHWIDAPPEKAPPLRAVNSVAPTCRATHHVPVVAYPDKTGCGRSSFAFLSHPALQYSSDSSSPARRSPSAKQITVSQPLAAAIHLSPNPQQLLQEFPMRSRTPYAPDESSAWWRIAEIVCLHRREFQHDRREIQSAAG